MDSVSLEMSFFFDSLSGRERKPKYFSMVSFVNAKPILFFIG